MTSLPIMFYYDGVRQTQHPIQHIRIYDNLGLEFM